MSDYAEGLRFLAGAFGLSIAVGGGLMFGIAVMWKLLGCTVSITREAPQDEP